MNDLIAAPAGHASGGFYDCVGMVTSARSLADDLATGDVAGGALDSAILAAETAAMIVDPIASLATSAAAWLMTYVYPLPDMLDDLVGSPTEVSAMSQTWINIQGQVETSRSDVTSAVNDALNGWEGFAADGYREMSRLFGEVMDGVAMTAGGVAAGLQAASAVIELIRTIIIQLVSTLVGQLISMAIKAAATLLVGTPVIVGQATVKIGETTLKATKWTDQLITMIKNVATKVDEINEILNVAIPGIKASTATLTFSATDLVQDARDFIDNLSMEPQAAK